jgi:hypothetical protein
MKHSVDQARAQIAAAKNHAEKQDHENTPLLEMKDVSFNESCPVHYQTDDKMFDEILEKELNHPDNQE